MIIDLPRFIETERPTWTELEEMLSRLEEDPTYRMDLTAAMRFHYLFQKTSSDLGKIATFASEPALRSYLESLVGRAYSEIHETRESRKRFAPVRLFLETFPRVFRKHVGAFWLAAAITLAGSIFGAFAVTFDEDAKRAIVPAQFGHVMEDPAQRVADEESAGSEDRLGGAKASFSSFLMTNNIRVSILCMALGMTWGIGSVILLFYNGVMVGLVAADYILAGQTVFLLGWLLPHGVIEIPAILIGGQAGFVLARALIGRGDQTPPGERLRAVGRDVCVLVYGLAVMLVWAGLIEAFFSQYHYPVIPYAAKIAFGVIELILLIALLSRRGPKEDVE